MESDPKMQASIAPWLGDPLVDGFRMFSMGMFSMVFECLRWFRFQFPF